MGLTHFPNGVSSFGIPQLGGAGQIPQTTGTYFFVDDSGSNANDGKDPDHPFADLDYAVSQCTASHGDVIILMPGHAETTTTAIGIDIVGVTVIGLGYGDARPTITVNAAVHGLEVSADDCKISNIRVIAGSAVTAATRLICVAADDFVVSNVRFEMAYDMYNMCVVSSGDNVKFIDNEYINTVTTSASAHPQRAFLNITGTNVNITGGLVNDIGANKAERWRTAFAGGKKLAYLTVEDVTFMTRGIGVATRTAGASGDVSVLYCRLVSPSSNTAVQALITPTYLFTVECYNVAAINKQPQMITSSSDKRLKRSIAYL